MPIYQYACIKTGEVFEEILPISEWDRKLITCRLHFNRDTYLATGLCHDAERIWSLPVVRFEAKPTIIFRNPRTGECEVATHDSQQPPAGYIREELRGPIERSKFEKEQSQRKYVEDELLSEKLKQGREQTAKNIHDDINARMNSRTNKIYDPETKQDVSVEWDAHTKDMLKKSMAHTRKKHAQIKPKRTNVKLEVNHTDSSNMVK